MKGRKTSVESIVKILREMEILQGQGSSIDAACKKLGISSQSFYKWRKEYGKMDISKARKLKELEKENARLKRLVADLSLDNAMLKELSEGNF